MRSWILIVVCFVLACGFAQAFELPAGSFDTCYGHSLKTGADGLVLKASVELIGIDVSQSLRLSANGDAIAWVSDDVANRFGMGMSLGLSPTKVEAGKVALTGGAGILFDGDVIVYMGVKLLSF
jgi:hypothetical protein